MAYLSHRRHFRCWAHLFHPYSTCQNSHLIAGETEMFSSCVSCGGRGEKEFAENLRFFAIVAIVSVSLDTG